MNRRKRKKVTKKEIPPQVDIPVIKMLLDNPQGLICALDITSANETLNSGLLNKTKRMYAS